MYRDMPLNKLVEYWRKRWLTNRKQNGQIAAAVRDFRPEHFKIEKTRVDIGQNAPILTSPP
jgi:hypothetical protein